MITINDYTITEKEFDLACLEQKNRMRKLQLTEADLRYVADQLIDAKLLLDDAKQANIKVDKEAIDRTIENIKKNFGDESKFEQALEANNDTISDLQKKVENSLLLQNYLEEKFFSSVKVSSQEVQDYYDKYQEKFIQPEQVKASHILFNNEDQEEAKKVALLLKNGADFTEMAQEYSKCPSKTNGGDLGFFARGKMVPEFENASFSTPVGETTDLVKTQFGYHIIQITAKEEAKTLSFTEVKDELSKRIKNSIADHKIKEKAKLLRKESSIAIDDEKLQSKVNK